MGFLNFNSPKLREIKEKIPRPIREAVKSNILVRGRAGKMMDKPFMQEEDINMVSKVLEAFKPKNCLEWGSGGSTIYFPQKHSFIEKWVSIESNPNWYKEVLKKKPEKVDMKLMRGDDYAFGILKDKTGFDFILIDGMERERCMCIASLLLRDKGICILHDTWRKNYQTYFPVFKYWKKLTEGSLKSENGLCIFTNESREKLDII